MFSFDASQSVPPPYQTLTPIIPRKSCRITVVLSLLPNSIYSFKHVTYDTLKFTLFIFLWMVYLSSGFNLVEVNCLNFNQNLSFSPKYHKIKFDSYFLQMSMYLYTFWILFEPSLFIFLLEKTFFQFFPRKTTLFRLKTFVYFKIHRTCFRTFQYLICLFVLLVSCFQVIPFATLWYYQLVISLSNDISENPGPTLPSQPGEITPYFSFCNWNLNTLSKGDFSRVTLINAHNSIHKYDIISLCETSLSNNETVPENILPGYLYYPCNHPSGEKKVVLAFFIKTRYQLK